MTYAVDLSNLALEANGAAAGITANATAISAIFVGNSTVNSTINSTALSIGSNVATFGTTFYSVANGNVGIGTSGPVRLLEVLATGTAIPARLGNAQGNLDIGGSDGAVVNLDTRSWAMGLQTGGVERMRITTAGLVGIGTASPATLLDVNGTAHILTSLAVGADATSFTPSGLNAIPNYGVGYITTNAITTLTSFGAIAAYTAQTERFRITQAGNVGIGTTTPSNTLSVVGTAGISGALTVNGAITTGNTALGNNQVATVAFAIAASIAF